MVGGAWAVAALVAIFGARALDSPVGAGPIDEAQPIQVGAIVEPGAELTGRPSELPPLSLVLNDLPPPQVVNLMREERVAALEGLATDDDAELLLHLGAAYQSLGDGRSAADAYRRAAAADPDSSAPRVGLLMVDAASGSEGRARATAELAALADARPEDQVVTFNRGWLAVYERDTAVALEAWEQTRRTNARSPLGLAAGQLVSEIRRGIDGG